MRRERPHPLTHRASRLLWGRSRLSHSAARDPFGRVPEPEFRSCKTTSITPRKGESKDKDQSPRTKTQDGNLPRFMMSRASKASWTGMPNSVMILVFLIVAPSWLRKCPEKLNFLIEVFPFRGLLLVGGSIASKSLARCLQCGKVNGAPVSDAMELLEGVSEWPVPKRKMANHKDSP